MTISDPVPGPNDVAEPAGRDGFDGAFLGIDVPLPSPVQPDLPTVLLPYTHFSVLLRTDRRLAAVTGVAIDGDTLMDLDRSGIGWRLDPRVPAEQQTGEQVYARNDLDRGHLVRRADPVWGSTVEEAHQANVDTFHYTNAAPQAALFNQGRELWLGLEDYLLTHAATYQRRLVVFTGPVLDAGDPWYRGVQIPLRFYKVAAFLDAGHLAATGYLLDQTPLVDDVTGALAHAEEAGEPPPLGAYRTYQVPVADLAGLTGLGLGQLAAVDRPPMVPVTTGGASPDVAEAPGWVELTALSDIVLDRR